MEGFCSRIKGRVCPKFKLVILSALMPFLLGIVGLCTSAMAFGTRAQVQFINNSGGATPNGGSVLLENIAVGIVYANLVGRYHKTYFLVGNGASRSNFLSKMTTALNSYSNVDVFISAHGCAGPRCNNVDAFVGTDVVYDHNIRSVRTSTTNYNRMRAVYQMICYGFYLNEDWRYAGAKIVSGAKEVSANAPIEFPAWTGAWGLGFVSYGTARNSSWVQSAWIDPVYQLFTSTPVASYKHHSGNLNIVLW